MGLQQIIPDVSFTDTSLPRLSPDSMLNAGSLWLLDANHPAGAWPTSLDGTVALPNIAALAALPLIPDATPGQFTRTATWVPGTTGLVEKTSKGALHVIASRTNAVAGAGCYLDAPAPGVAYLRTNWEHSFYFSLWIRPTRQTLTGNYPYRWVAGDVPANEPSPANRPYFALLQTGGSPTSGARFLGRTGTIDTPGTPGVAAIAVAGASAAPVTSTVARVFWGSVGLINYSAANLGALASFAIERYYAEDLTVSGRTYAEAVAADTARHAIEHTIGGRYHNDTYTNPSTLA